VIGSLPHVLAQLSSGNKVRCISYCLSNTADRTSQETLLRNYPAGGATSSFPVFRGVIVPELHSLNCR
jgi:hypothetical protein